MIDTLYQADIFVRIFCQEYSGAYFLLGDFGSVGGRQSRACFYLQYELRLADQRVQQIKMVADHPLLSSAGTDNEAQGEVTERTDSHFPLRHDSQQKEYQG